MSCELEFDDELRESQFPQHREQQSGVIGND